ncbi:MAG: 1-deoxy-D-xylulose-5-phosphate reductoisomerase [Clostridia bacterium]|nr:1-deoxy-D-xylulose-5-phosphate reductoisomerase [Clostridia bacterium]
MKKISIIGSTGSIGTQTLEVCDNLQDVQIMGLSANNNVKLAEEQIRKYSPKLFAMVNEDAAKALKIAVADTDTKVISGTDCMSEISTMEEIDTVVTSVVGIAGLVPTMNAIEKGVNIALANKETLVTAGSIVMKAAADNNVSILPVDSEHSAIFQCIGNHPQSEINRLIITASGGSFYGKKAEELENVSVKEALNHPNWSMGQKITIDSATLMNKGLEVIEAHWLYGIDYDDIDVVVHRESIVHSLVEFKDMSVLAQLGLPDMKLPIHYALCYPHRIPSGVKQLNLWEVGNLTFGKPDYDTFRCLSLAIKAGREGGTMPTVLNGANEVAVELFLKGKIKFNDIARIVENAMENHKNVLNPKLDDIIYTDKCVREEVYSKC